MNLVKWFRKNNKKVMAVVVIVIMFGFVGGSALERLLQRPATGLRKTVAQFQDSRNITNQDLLLAAQELEILKLVQADVMLRSIWDPLLRVSDLRALMLGQLLFSDRAISPALIGRIRQIVRANDYRVSLKQINDIYRRAMPVNVYWFLLGSEAELVGVRISNSKARQYLSMMIREVNRGARTYSDVVGPVVNRRRISEDQILTAFARLLAVLEYASIVCLGENITTQQIMHKISWGGETIDVEFVRFDSSEFAEDQNEPTQQQILAHFDKYRKFMTGAVSEQNPYGFGYKLADRIGLEYIAVKLDDVSQIVDRPTQQEAEEYYQRHRDTFTEQVLSDPNDPNSLTERVKSYAEVAGDIVRLLLWDKTNSKAKLILQEAKMLTESGFEDTDVESADLTAEQFRQMAGDYKVSADQLSEKYGIKVYAGRTGLLSAVDIARDENLGKLYVRGSGYGPVPLGQIVFAVDELRASELGPFDIPRPRMYENIGPVMDITGQVVKDVKGQIMAVVRVIEAKKASEPESIDQTFTKATLNLEPTEDQPGEGVYSVKEKVVEDLKKLAAMDTVKGKADEFRDLVAKEGWDEAVDRFNEVYGGIEASNEADPNVSRTQDPNEVEKPFRLRTLTNLPRISNIGLDTLVLQSAGNPAAQLSVDGAFQLGELTRTNTKV